MHCASMLRNHEIIVSVKHELELIYKVIMGLRDWLSHLVSGTLRVRRSIVVLAMKSFGLRRGSQLSPPALFPLEI